MLFTRLLDALPGLCDICHGWGHSRICAPCRERYSPPVTRCLRCAIVLPSGQAQCGECLRDPPPFERTVTAVDYAHPWDALITRFKFHAALDLAPAMAACLWQAVQASATSRPGLLVPVPLSEARLRERGYNQSWELARRLGRMLDVPADARVLVRVRDTPHQIALPIDHRATNVRGAFAIEPRRRAPLAGCEVAVIDDVFTSGATAAEISRTLLQCGAARVQVWTLARTPRPGAS